jgi:hypothetical protein
MCATCGCGQRDKTHPKYGKGPNKGKMIKKSAKKMSPKQKNLDVDKDGKLEGSDFAALRKKKK